MSVVASIIKKVVSVVEDVVETVVGVVEDVADFVVEEIIEPVVKTVETVVEAVIDDPIAAIATVAAYATGNAWAVPLINAADTAAKGGNVGDILKSAAIGYVAPKAGSYVSGAVTGATGSAVAGSVAGAAASGVVKGKNLKDALIGGVIPEIASASLDVVKNTIPNYDIISSPGADSAIEKGIAKYIESGGDVTEAALAATATNLGTVIKDNTNFNGDISNAISAAVVAGMQDPEAALPTFKASLNTAGVKDLNAKIDDYLFTPEEEVVEAAPITDTPAAAEEEMGAPVESTPGDVVADLETAGVSPAPEEAELTPIEKALLKGVKSAAEDTTKGVEVASLDSDEAFKLAAEAEVAKTAEEELESILDLYEGTEAGDFVGADDAVDVAEEKDTSYLADYEPVTIDNPIDKRREEDELDRLIDDVGAAG